MVHRDITMGQTHWHTQHTTRTTSFFNNSPNSSNKRNAPMCFKCGEQFHMRNECEIERVFCTYCKSTSHSNRECGKLTNSTPNPTNSYIPTGYHPTATHHYYQEIQQTLEHTPQHNPNRQAHPTMDFGSRTIKTQINLVPAPPYKHSLQTICHQYPQAMWH